MAKDKTQKKSAARNFHAAHQARRDANHVPRPTEVRPVHTLGLCENKRAVLTAFAHCAARKTAEEIIALAVQHNPDVKPRDLKIAAGELLSRKLLVRDEDKAYLPTKVGQRAVTELKEIHALQ